MPVRDVKLYDGTGYIEIDNLPVESECFLLFLTNRELHIITRFLLPFATWTTRLVRFVAPKAGKWPGAVFQTATDVEYSEYLSEIDQLSLKLEGDNVSCTEIADGLNAIAIALAGQQPGLGCTVNCGGSGGVATLGSALAGIPDTGYADVAAQTPPDEGVPPEGFETWAAYRVWKCQAAHAIWMEIDRFLGFLEGFDGIMVIAAVAAPGVAYFAGVSFAAITAGGIVTIVAAILAMAAVWVSNALIIAQMRTYWLDHQSAILCEMYDSGDAATALLALGNAVEDMIQAIEWGAVLGPLSGVYGAALGTAIGAVETNSLVNPLFKLVTGVALATVDCPCSELPSSVYWHFPADDMGWLWSLDGSSGRTWADAWLSPGHNGACPDQGEDAGQLEDHCSGSGGNDQCKWKYSFPVGYHPVAVSGEVFQARYITSQGAGTGVFAVIQYDDNVEDSGYQASGAGWSTVAVTVATGNVGKAIKSVKVTHNQGTHSQERWFTIDNVRLVQP